MLLSQFQLIFFQTQNGMLLFIAQLMTILVADWVGFQDYISNNVPWEDILKLGASAVAAQFCEWAQVAIYVYIHRCKYQVKPNSSPWFSAACAAAIAHRNQFHLYQQNKSSASNVKFRQANNRCKRVLEVSKQIKQKSLSLLRNFAHATFHKG